jgi:hypothetical protein
MVSRFDEIRQAHERHLAVADPDEDDLIIIELLDMLDAAYKELNEWNENCGWGTKDGNK